jgi:hypothetical protein
LSSTFSRHNFGVLFFDNTKITYVSRGIEEDKLSKIVDMMPVPSKYRTTDEISIAVLPESERRLYLRLKKVVFDERDIPVQVVMEHTFHRVKGDYEVTKGLILQIYTKLMKKKEAVWVLKEPPFEIKDEYDVQNLVHAVLKVDFNDVRKEDVSPICAGAYSRIDLVLKEAKILIEIKKTNSNNREKEIGSQLVEDITRYKSYPDANILVCSIYDPEHWIENPEGLIGDLGKQSTQALNIEVIICPKTQ